MSHNQCSAWLLGVAALCLLVWGGCGAAPAQPAARPSPPASPAAGGAAPAPTLPNVAPTAETLVSVPPVVPAEAPLAPSADECPRLERSLLALSLEAEPLAAAERLGIAIDEGRVQVEIIFAGPAPAELAGYGAEITGRSGESAQAFVPFAQLCALASDPQVRSVALPAPAIPG